MKEAVKENKLNKAELNWEIKDRVYYLCDGTSPLTYVIASKHQEGRPLLYFDEELGYERELRYANNQKSVFVDEQVGTASLEHIIFEDGVLHVPKNKQTLQKLLSLYHPQRGVLFTEFDAISEAKDEIEDIMLEAEALNAALGLEVSQAEAVLRVEQGSEVSKMSSAEIKRDILLFAKREPKLFLDLVSDENVMLRNFAIKAAEFGIIRLDEDQRTFKWASNGKKLMTVPFDENPFSAMAAFFKTDEGLDIYKSIEKKIGV